LVVATGAANVRRSPKSKTKVAVGAVNLLSFHFQAMKSGRA